MALKDELKKTWKNKVAFMEMLCAEHPSLEGHRVHGLTEQEKDSQADSLLRLFGGTFAVGYTFNTTHQERFTLPAMTGSLQWWMVRERLRFDTEVYETSDVIKYLRTTMLGHYMPHVTPGDVKSISYTPSVEYGMSDRRLTTSMGKFLSKYALCFSDQFVQGLEQAHRAEVAVEIQFARTKEQINDVYRNMPGDNGCMRYAPATFDLAEDLHPSMIYEAPGVAIAYITDAAGRYKARCVTYVNPRDDTDRRWIRIYGDPVLQKLLERAGFVGGGLAGATLPLIPARNVKNEPVPDSYVCSYIDPHAGIKSNADGAYGIITADGIRVLSVAEHAKYQKRFPGYLISIRSNHGKLRGKMLPDLHVTSNMTGDRLNRLETEVENYIEDSDWGKVLVASAEELKLSGLYKLQSKMLTARWLEAGDEELDAEWVSVYHTSNVPRFGSGGEFYVDSPISRRMNGHVMLKPELYGDNCWLGSDYAVLSGQGHYGLEWATRRTLPHIASEDAVRVYMDDNDNGSYYFVHKTEVAAMKADGYIQTIKIDEYDGLIKADAANLRTSDTGYTFSVNFPGPYREVTLRPGVFRHFDTLVACEIMEKHYFFEKTADSKTDWDAVPDSVVTDTTAPAIERLRRFLLEADDLSTLLANVSDFLRRQWSNTDISQFGCGGNKTIAPMSIDQLNNWKLFNELLGTSAVDKVKNFPDFTMFKRLFLAMYAGVQDILAGTLARLGNGMKVVDITTFKALNAPVDRFWYNSAVNRMNILCGEQVYKLANRQVAWTNAMHILERHMAFNGPRMSEDTIREFFARAVLMTDTDTLAAQYPEVVLDQDSAYNNEELAILYGLAAWARLVNAGQPAQPAVAAEAVAA